MYKQIIFLFFCFFCFGEYPNGVDTSPDRNKPQNANPTNTSNELPEEYNTSPRSTPATRRTDEPSYNDPASLSHKKEPINTPSINNSGASDIAFSCRTENNDCCNVNEFPTSINDINSKTKDEIERLNSHLDTHISRFTRSDEEGADDKANECKDIKRIYTKALKNKEEEEEDLKQCTEAVAEMRKAGTEFRKSCASFVSGSMRCVNALEACDNCPSEEDFADYDCVRIHEQTQCPALAGKELEEAEERREDIAKEIRDLQEDIDEQERDINSKKEELNEALMELETSFIETTRNLERDTEDAKVQLEEALKKGKLTIEKNLAQQLATVQASIDNSLKTAHAFENAISQAHREYRRERRQIIMECETQAKVDLAQYRQRRRRAIETGSLTISVSSLLQRGRVSFAQKDAALFQKYNSRCLSRRREDFKAVKEDYNQKLRLIEQQKEQYLESLIKQRDQLKNLNQDALKAQNSLVQDYTEQMDKILTNYNKEYQAAITDYNRQKSFILSQTKAIHILERQLRKKIQSLKNKQTELVREKELIHYLKSRGVPYENTRDQYSEAVAATEDYKDHIEIAKDACGCNDKEKESNSNKAKKCNSIKTAEDSAQLEDDSPYEGGGFNRGNRDGNR